MFVCVIVLAAFSWRLWRRHVAMPGDPFYAGVVVQVDKDSAQPTRVDTIPIRIVEASAGSKTNTAPVFIPQGVPYTGRLEVLLVKSPFRRIDDPRDKDGNFVEGPICQWKITQLQRLQGGEWNDLPLPDGNIAAPQTDINLNSVTAEEIGRWKMTVRVDVECFNDLGHVWKGSTTRDIAFEVLPQTIERQKHVRWAQHERQKLVQWAQQTGQPSSARPIPLQPGTSYISHLEWRSEDTNSQRKILDRTGWQKVPQAGDANYPLTIPEHSFIKLRAVRRDPNLPWPNFPQRMPTWSKSQKPDFPMYGPEMSFSVFFPSRSEPDNHTPTAQDRVVSATCGNTVKTTIRVVSDLDTAPLAQISLALLDNNNATTTSREITAGSTSAAKIYVSIGRADGSSQGEGLHGIRLRAFYADGSGAGTFKMSRAKDSKVLYVGAYNNRYDNAIEYSTAPRTGTVSIVAETLDASHQIIKSAPLVVKLVQPTLTVSPGSWEWNGEHWQRKLRIDATTSKGLIAGNLRFRLHVVTPKGYSINQSASWFDAREGQTTEYGWADMTQNWKFVPGASLNMDSYEVEAVPVVPSKSSTQ
jgi:hypothetical protein